MSGSDHSVDAEKLREHLQQVTEQRDGVQAQIKKLRSELDALTSNGPKRPRQRLMDVEDRIAELEHRRTTESIPLKEERAILREMEKLEKARREAAEYEEFDSKVKELKELRAEQQESLKTLNEAVVKARAEASAAKSAEELGCSVDDLKEIELDCPQDKLRKVVGKNGRNIKQLEEKTHVSVKIEGIKIRITGSQSALDAAKLDLDHILLETEETFDLLPKVVAYLTSKNMTALSELRQRHPHVNISITRASNQACIRGAPAAIGSAKKELLNFAVTEREIRAPSPEAMAVLGKHGDTAQRLVSSFQVEISVKRDDNGESVVRVSGPPSNVERALVEVNELLSSAKDVTETLSVDKCVKNLLLARNGAGIKDLQRKVSAVTKEQGGSVYLGVDGDDLIVRSKACVIELAVQTVEESIRSLEASIVTITVDPVAFASFVGKDGATLRKLQNGASVNVEIDRAAGEISICGTDAAQLNSVVDSFNDVASKSVVKRLNVSDTVLDTVYRDLLRSGCGQEVSKLVFMMADESNSQIALRGSEENLEKATSLVEDYLSKNYVEAVTVSSEEMDVLLSGGRDSQIVALARELGVKLASRKDRGVVLVRGEADKVRDAVVAIVRFLRGDDDTAVVRIPLDDRLIGVVVGKRGKNKADLQRKFEDVSIVVQSGANVVNLHGPKEQVEACRMDIVRVVSTVRVSETVQIPDNCPVRLDRGRVSRVVPKSVPVQIHTTASSVTVRGSAADVQYAVGLLNEQFTGVHEARIVLHSTSFKKCESVCRERSHLDRIERPTGVKITLDATNESLVVNGAREKVKLAKPELVKFLQFVLSTSFSHFEFPNSLSSLSFSATDVAIASGAAVCFDRDANSVYVSSESPAKVEKASSMLAELVKDAEKLAFEVQLDPTEDWLVSSLIGKNGSRISALRKATKCSIEVVSKDRRLVVSGNDEDLVAKARVTIQDVVDLERRKCVLVDIPEGDVSAFVGRSGGHISQFRTEHGVEVKLMGKPTSRVRLMGDEKAVSVARSALSEWLATRAQERAGITLTIRQDQASALIGNKGSVARSLEEEFGCKLDINRKQETVTVRGGKEESRDAAIAKIKQILAEASSEPASTGDPADDSPNAWENGAPIAKKDAESTTGGEQLPTTQKPIKSQGVSELDESDVPSLAISPSTSFEQSDFPSLPATIQDRKRCEVATKETEDESGGSLTSSDKADDESENGSPQNVAYVSHRRSWADVTARPTELSTSRSFVSIVSEECWDATSFCSEAHSDDGLVEEVEAMNEHSARLRDELENITVAVGPEVTKCA